MTAQARALPLDYDTALENNLWGYFWASIAAEGGIQAAAALPLPKSDEVTAQQFAETFRSLRSPTLVTAQMWADATASLAIEAFKVAQPLLNRARQMHPIGPTVWRDVDEAMSAAEHLGRAGANAQRTLTLLASKQAGGR